MKGRWLGEREREREGEGGERNIDKETNRNKGIRAQICSNNVFSFLECVHILRSTCTLVLFQTFLGIE